MKHPQHSKAQRPGAILKATALATLLAASNAHAFDSGSTGADGALAPAANSGVVEIQLPESGILNYTTVNIPVGVTLKFKRNTLNTPVVMLASGNVTIAGTVDVSGGHGAYVGTAGDGSTGDDGVPGRGGPGGFDGGRGGSTDPANRLGGAGLGPGGGKGGILGADGCGSGRYYKYIGGGAGHSSYGVEITASNPYYISTCGWPRSDAVGVPYGNALLQPLIGGSGGGGGLGGINFSGSGGGGGGGAALIASSGTLSLTGGCVVGRGHRGFLSPGSVVVQCGLRGALAFGVVAVVDLFDELLSCLPFVSQVLDLGKAFGLVVAIALGEFSLCAGLGVSRCKPSRLVVLVVRFVIA